MNPTQEKEHEEAISSQMYNIMHHCAFIDVERYIKDKNPDFFENDYKKLTRGQRFHFCMALIERNRKTTGQ